MGLFFHNFELDTARMWRGGDTCTCGQTRHEHVDNIQHDWSAFSAYALADLISSELRASWHVLREARRRIQSSGPESYAYRDAKHAEHYATLKLEEFFHIRNVGLGRESGGSLHQTMMRKRLAQVCAAAAAMKAPAGEIAWQRETFRRGKA